MSLNSLQQKDMSYTLSYKVRTHIYGRQIFLKNRLGMVSTINYVKPFHIQDDETCFIDVELVVYNIYELRFNPDMVTNSLDKAILKAIMERVEYIKKNLPIDAYPNHLGERILVNVPLTMACNYNSNGYQSDAFGFTIEFKDESYPGFYKEDEYDVELKTISIQNAIHSEGFKRDFIFRLYRVVDNQRKIGPLWVTIGGESVRLTPVMDPNKSDGIYIYSGVGASKLKVINVDEITKDVLTSNGLSKSKLDMENTPHNKVFVELTKENAGLKKKVSELETTIKTNEDRNTKLTDKLNNRIVDLEFDSKEKDRIINRMKETHKDQKEFENNLTRQMQFSHKQEVERLKSNQEYNNIQGFSKALKDLIGTFTSITKLFALG